MAIEQTLKKRERQALRSSFRNYPEVDCLGYWRQAQTNYDLTEDLNDENFKLEITMPGTIIVTNGKKVNHSTVYWEFNGKDLINRHIPIEAVSVVE